MTKHEKLEYLYKIKKDISKFGMLKWLMEMYPKQEKSIYEIDKNLGINMSIAFDKIAYIDQYFAERLED